MIHNPAPVFDKVWCILSDVQDIVTRRVTGPEVPNWCASRGWESFLLGLSDEALAQCEARGMDRCCPDLPGVPASLRQLAERVQDAIRMPRVSTSPAANLDRRWVAFRKQGQIRALLQSCGPWAEQATRVVEVGAGHGHTTRLAARHWSCAAVGLERNATLVDTARRLAKDRQVRYEVFDAFRQKLMFESGDLVIGLHACGELGDVVLRSAVESRAPMILVSCCLQKLRSTVRSPLSQRAGAASFALPREVLGLTNLMPRPKGFAASIEETMAARRDRHAVRLLLGERGLQVDHGEEMQGINRRRARGGFETLALRALSARGLEPASASELADVRRRAKEEFGRIRRLSLPRSMLGRLVEVAVVLDRACFAQEGGFGVEVGELFDAEMSPRNLVIRGRP